MTTVHITEWELVGAPKGSSDTHLYIDMGELFQFANAVNLPEVTAPKGWRVHRIFRHPPLDYMVAGRWYAELAPDDEYTTIERMAEAAYYLMKVGCQQYRDEQTLVNLLYFSDREAYAQRSVSITGARYLRFPYGPLPANWQMVLHHLNTQYQVALLYQNEESRLYRLELRFLTLPTPRALSQDDLKILANTAMLYKDFSTRQMIQLGQLDWRWRILRDGEQVPLDSDDDDYEFPKLSV